MKDLELLARVRLLRAEVKAPKQIARILGLSPSVVAPLVRAVAAERDEIAVASAVIGGWVNQGWSHGFDKVTVCGYLADVYGLGIKHTHGPEVMTEFELAAPAAGRAGGFVRTLGSNAFSATWTSA